MGQTVMKEKEGEKRRGRERRGRRGRRPQAERQKQQSQGRCEVKVKTGPLFALSPPPLKVLLVTTLYFEVCHPLCIAPVPFHRNEVCSFVFPTTTSSILTSLS